MSAPLNEEKAPESEEKVTLGVSDIASIVDNAVQRAVAQALAARPPASLPATTPGPRIMKNRDFELQNMGQGRQTQEDVVTLATTVGPVTHGRGFIPSPPEYVAHRDMEEHRSLINQIEQMGYVVYLDRVEFHARWEPTKSEIQDNKRVRVRVFDQKEPPQANPLLLKLEDLDARNSRIWIQTWLKGKFISGERQIDEIASDEQHKTQLVALRDQELAKVEMGARDHLDNVEIPV